MSSASREEDVVALPRLDQLPGELVSNISIKLDSDGIFAFRLTCKALALKSFHEFATEYFSEKGFIFTSESLKVLVNIANHPKLSTYLHHIYIIPAFFVDLRPVCPNGDACVSRPSVRNQEALRTYISDQKSLKKTGSDRQMLTHAFSKLEALHRLTFSDTTIHMSESADVRGLTKAHRTMNKSPSMLPQSPDDDQYFRFKNHVWKTTIKAIVNSGIASLTHINTDLNTMKNSLEIPAHLNFDTKTRLGLRKPLQGLKTISLQIRSRELTHPDEDDDGIDIVKGGQAMRRLADLMPSLEDVGLKFSYSPSSRVLGNRFMSNINHSKLTRLHLSSMYTDAQSLGVTICKVIALKDLQLVWINLTEGSWVPVLQAMEKLDQLKHLHLFYLNVRRQAAHLLAQTDEDDGNSFPFGPEPDEDLEGEVDSDDDDLPDLEDVDANESTGVALPDDEEDEEESDSDPEDDLFGPEPPSTTTGPAHGTNGNGTTTLAATNGAHAHSHGPGCSHDPGANQAGRPEFDKSDFYGELPGRCICLQNDQIRNHLPTLISEYNLGLDDPSDTFGLGMPPIAAGPGGAQAILNNLTAALGQPVNVAGNPQNGTATFSLAYGPFPGGPLGGGGVAGAIPPFMFVPGVNPPAGPPNGPAAPAPNANVAAGQGNATANGMAGQAHAHAGAEGMDENDWEDEEDVE